MRLPFLKPPFAVGDNAGITPSYKRENALSRPSRNPVFSKHRALWIRKPTVLFFRLEFFYYYCINFVQKLQLFFAKKSYSAFLISKGCTLYSSKAASTIAMLKMERESK